jgi:hypothetical protein
MVDGTKIILDEQVDQNVQSVVEVGTEYLQKCS